MESRGEESAVPCVDCKQDVFIDHSGSLCLDCMPKNVVFEKREQQPEQFNFQEAKKFVICDKCKQVLHVTHKIVPLPSMKYQHEVLKFNRAIQQTIHLPSQSPVDCVKVGLIFDVNITNEIVHDTHAAPAKLKDIEHKLDLIRRESRVAMDMFVMELNKITFKVFGNGNTDNSAV